MATVYLKTKQKLRGIRWMLLAVLTVLVLQMIGSFFDGAIPTYLEALIVGLCAYVIPISIYARIDGVTANAAAERFYLKPCRWWMFALAALMGVGFQFVMIVADLPLNMLFNNATSYTPESPTELAAAIFVIRIIRLYLKNFCSGESSSALCQS